MRAKTTTDFKRGQEPKRSLGIGISPKDWAKRVSIELMKYGIKSNIEDDDEIYLIFGDSFSKISELQQNEIYISFWEEEWNLVSGGMQKTILVVTDKNIEELISEIVRFEYDDDRDMFISIGKILNKENE